MLGMIEGVGHLISTTFSAAQQSPQEPLMKTSIAARAHKMAEERKAKLPKRSKEAFPDEVVHSLPTFRLDDDLLDTDKFALA